MPCLIIENHAVLRKVFTDILKSELPYINIQEAADGAEALRMIQHHPPFLIFLDSCLQGENSMELTRKIKALSPKAILIVLDFFGFPEYRDAASSSGADYFLDINSLVLHEISALVKSILLERGHFRDCSDLGVPEQG
jgi:DNA-binding NarL/FixJ family response regulator